VSMRGGRGEVDSRKRGRALTTTTVGTQHGAQVALSNCLVSSLHVPLHCKVSILPHLVASRQSHIVWQGTAYVQAQAACANLSSSTRSFVSPAVRWCACSAWRGQLRISRLVEKRMTTDGRGRAIVAVKQSWGAFLREGTAPRRESFHVLSFLAQADFRVFAWRVMGGRLDQFRSNGLTCHQRLNRKTGRKDGEEREMADEYWMRKNGCHRH
jgi:hypothetical protein